MTNEQVKYVMDNHWTLEDTTKGICIYDEDGSVSEDFTNYCKQQKYI